MALFPEEFAKEFAAIFINSSKTAKLDVVAAVFDWLMLLCWPTAVQKAELLKLLQDQYSNP